MPFSCPTCRAEAQRLIAYEKEGRLGCDACGVPKPSFSNCRLGQTEDKWRGPDGQLHRLTVGKSNEISWRRITPDGVINSRTKRPTQY